MPAASTQPPINNCQHFYDRKILPLSVLITSASTAATFSFVTACNTIPSDYCSSVTTESNHPNITALNMTGNRTTTQPASKNDSSLFFGFVIVIFSIIFFGAIMIYFGFWINQRSKPADKPWSRRVSLFYFGLPQSLCFTKAVLLAVSSSQISNQWLAQGLPNLILRGFLSLLFFLFMIPARTAEASNPLVEISIHNYPKIVHRFLMFASTLNFYNNTNKRRYAMPSLLSSIISALTICITFSISTANILNAILLPSLCRSILLTGLGISASASPLILMIYFEYFQQRLKTKIFATHEDIKLFRTCPCLLNRIKCFFIPLKHTSIFFFALSGSAHLYQSIALLKTALNPLWMMPCFMSIYAACQMAFKKIETVLAPSTDGATLDVSSNLAPAAT